MKTKKKSVRLAVKIYRTTKGPMAGELMKTWIDADDGHCHVVHVRKGGPHIKIARADFAELLRETGATPVRIPGLN